MYKRIAASRIRRVFDAIGRQDYDAATDGVADDVHHLFPGTNALGGERHSRDALMRWFERLGRLFPQLAFEVQRVSVKGPPWDMWIAVQWTDEGRAADGTPYHNRGAHWIRIRRGRAVFIQAYLDTDLVTPSCQRMAGLGIVEAASPQITD
ncbi:MAG TPA: nuclear transport factor 2 family protein [Solirubrobacterales bacterium]|nr:nuclear transport factor 2 family protein [Solirubrobacterales bacterium]